MDRITTDRSTPRTALVTLLALAVLLTYSVAALAAIQVPLHSSHVGASSSTFGTDPDDGGLTAPVVWHFVLNQLDAGTAPAQLTVTFASGGTKGATGIPSGNGSMQHFYVGTSGHDTIMSASAMVESTGGKLVLSHVRVDIPDPPNDPPDDPPDPPNDPPNDPPDDPPDPPNDPPTDPPDDPPDPPSDPPKDPPNDPPGNPPSDPPDDPQDPPEDPQDPEEPYLPFTEQAEPEPEDELPYLPFSGGSAAPLALAGILAAAAGTGLRLGAWRLGKDDEDTLA